MERCKKCFACQGREFVKETAPPQSPTWSNMVNPRTFKRSSYIQMLYKFLLWRLTPYRDDASKDHQFGFRRHRLTAYQILCSSYIKEKNGSFLDSTSDIYILKGRISRELFYNTVTEFGTLVKIWNSLLLILVMLRYNPGRDEFSMPSISYM
jgi:hypothetical protein